MTTNDYGTVTYEGIEYRLTQQAWVDADLSGPKRTVYRAYAEGPDAEGDDAKYLVTWPVVPGQDMYADDYVGEDEAYEDESMMCDWDSPESVRQVG